MRGTSRLPSVIALAMGLMSGSCGDLSGPEKEQKIPFDYDRDFDYLSVLKSSPRYANEAMDGLPSFTYQGPSDENLSELRAAYGLESAMGDGDELSRIFNLLRWVHGSLRHSGTSTVAPENSLTILRHAEVSGTGVNCVMMAIVLNEAYLAMGFKSRVIHGNSRDWVFNGDWHAFNAVYSYALDKWIFVDPSNQAHFSDDHGTPLSPAEVRERLRQDLPLHLNEDADYNGAPLNGDDYLHYLSKNLYRFSSSLDSAFGNYWIFHLPEGAQRVYVHLDPRYDRQKGLSLAVNNFSSNPAYFWSRP